MMPSESPTLAHDEVTLQRYAGQLADAFEKVAQSWLERLVERRAVGLDVSAELDRVAVETVADLRTLLATDIAKQPVGPLEVLRRAVRGPTAILQAAGVPVPARDAFAQRNFPDDIYDLTPASFGDVDVSLHEPGLVWGAAKAHVHLRRRREREAEPAIQSAAAPASERGSGVVALSVDLIDRSKISAAYPDAVLVRSAASLAEKAVGASLVLVDLGRLGDAGALAELDGRVVAFGSHVDDAALSAAAAAGAEALPRSVFFRRLEQRDL